MEKPLKGFKQILTIILLLWGNSRDTSGLGQGFESEAKAEKKLVWIYIALKKCGCTKDIIQMCAVPRGR